MLLLGFADRGFESCSAMGDGTPFRVLPPTPNPAIATAGRSPQWDLRSCSSIKVSEDTWGIAGMVIHSYRDGSGQAGRSPSIIEAPFSLNTLRIGGRGLFCTMAGLGGGC